MVNITAVAEQKIKELMAEEKDILRVARPVLAYVLAVPQHLVPAGLVRALGERAHELADGRLEHTQELRECLLLRGQVRHLLEVLARKHRPAERHEGRHEQHVVPGEALDQARRRTRIVLREGEDQRTLELLADALELSAGDCPTGQRVLHHPHVDAGGTGLGTQLGELRDRQPPVLRGDDGLRALRDLRHLGDQRLREFAADTALDRRVAVKAIAWGADAILLIVAIIASLAFALRSMLRPKSDAPERTAKMLTVRIGLSLLLFLLVMLTGLWSPRFWCRYLCPLGALLGAVSRFSLFRIACDKAKCTGCGACVDVCPVDCFYEGENMLVINPSECIDCGVCEPECPAEAILPDTESGLEQWLELNATYSAEWPNITRKGTPPPDADALAAEDALLGIAGSADIGRGCQIGGAAMMSSCSNRSPREARSTGSSSARKRSPAVFVDALSMP